MQAKQTKTLEAIFNAGAHEARRRHAKEVTMDHLFLAILKQDGGHASHVLNKVLKTWELYQIRIRLERELGPILLPENHIHISTNVEFDETRLLEQIRTTVPCVVQDFFNTGHLLQTIVEDRSLLSSRILTLYNVTPSTVLSFLHDMPPNEDYYEDMQFLSQLGSEEEEEHPERLVSGVMRIAITDGAKKKEHLLDQFGTDLTRSAADGKLDPVVGREEEIERLIQILGRRKKNNPVLIGEAGVGKSAIIEGLALRIVQKRVPHGLLRKRLFSLDVASLVAGTKYRGQFEERMHALLKELTNSDVILFIDEIHTIVGAGSTQGSLDTANILKPALARGELQCIGATTLNEYRESIESDSALERRFQKILVEQPSAEETLCVLHNIKNHYESHHSVRYTEAALEACVSLTQRYITDRYFPDKAIDVMDEAGSRTHLFNATPPEALMILEQEVCDVAAGKDRAIKTQNYEEAAALRNREEALRSRLTEMETQWKLHVTQHPVEIDEQAIYEVIASMTGIPMTRLSNDELTRLKNMNQHLSSVVIGQEEAVNQVTKAIRRSRTGLKDANRPIGVFMFVGPTGVGKTHIAKQLARYLFDSEDAMIRIDMSEYAEKHNVSRLIGSPPGYVGYGEGGQLTEKVRRHPYSVLLFDEIEKAHSDVFNLMLQIFDDGQLTDGQGRRIDFRNTIIIMTSNIGSREVMQRGSSLGYQTSQTSASEQLNRTTVYRKSLERSFAPEFINRIDDIVTFDSLSEKDVLRITSLEIKNLNHRLGLLGYSIEVSREAKQELVRQGYDLHYGVRSLKRTILDQVEDPIAELILTGEVQDGSHIAVHFDKDQIRFSVTQTNKLANTLAS